ncbi:MAG: VanZ family protein [Ferruginibacter sp.]
MMLRSFCKYSVITGTIIIWIIKFALRPYIHFTQPAKYLLGIAPNLLGAFLLPLGCYWLLNKYINLHVDKQLRWFCAVCFCLLIINEVLQLIPIFGRTFDYNDIIFSSVGLLFSYVVFGKIQTIKAAEYGSQTV